MYYFFRTGFHIHRRSFDAPRETGLYGTEPYRPHTPHRTVHLSRRCRLASRATRRGYASTVRGPFGRAQNAHVRIGQRTSPSAISVERSSDVRTTKHNTSSTSCCLAQTLCCLLPCTVPSIHAISECPIVTLCAALAGSFRACGGERSSTVDRMVPNVEKPQRSQCCAGSGGVDGRG